MTIYKKKISIIGAGNIGGTLAYLIMLKNLGDVILLDIRENIAQGKALDISETAPIERFYNNIIGTKHYKEIENSDVIIITAGITRQSNMNREDLIKINIKVIQEVSINIKKYSPNAFIIVVTNPLDVMVSAVHKYAQIPDNMIVGMAGVLDSARFRYFLAIALKMSVADICAFVLGGHNDTMVPLIRYTSIAGIPLTHMLQIGLITQNQIDEIIHRTRNGGKEIIDFLQNGSAYFAPTSSIISILQSFLYNERRILPCAAYLNGEYGITGLFIGVPTIIGNNGIERIIEVQMNDSEYIMFNKSINSVKNLMSLIDL
ncbi:malate dehydrogenase [Wolbachia endosymbiont of Howardula sp.]|uniref:malate dehydrogenase n=1 Tax=Wolbachia endosymbiont of Howardula sp. TaxID=2916816 RepID=UPI00217D9808|nr:malate dehydrogenase [Wolbachia endosymbiont of Howardula sp.]UWI83314.1 malate dehydrogenase [Wolbachia endosymbiont of Howardula sp.]